MKDLFQRNVSNYNLRSINDLTVPRVNQTTFGLKSIHYEGAVIWNHLPNNIKNADSTETFEKLIKTWRGPQCKFEHRKYFNRTNDHS